MSRLAELAAQIAKMISEMLLALFQGRRGGTVIASTPAAVGNSFIEDSNKLIDVQNKDSNKLIDVQKSDKKHENGVYHSNEDVQKSNKKHENGLHHSNEIIKLKHYENDSNRALFAHLYAQTPKNKRHLLPRRIEIELRSKSKEFAKWITDLDANELSILASSQIQQVQDHIKNKMLITDLPRIDEVRPQPLPGQAVQEADEMEVIETDAERALFAHLYAQTPKNKRHLLPGRYEIEQRSKSKEFAKWITELDDNELSKIASSQVHQVQNHIKNKMLKTGVRMLMTGVRPFSENSEKEADKHAPPAPHAPKKIPHSNEIIKLKRYDNDSNRASFVHQYAQTPRDKRNLLPARSEIEQRSKSKEFAKWITDLDDKELSKIASSKYYRVLDHIKNKMMITDVPRIGESKSAHEKLLEAAAAEKLRMKPKIKKPDADDPDSEYSGPAPGM